MNDRERRNKEVRFPFQEKISPINLSQLTSWTIEFQISLYCHLSKNFWTWNPISALFDVHLRRIKASTKKGWLVAPLNSLSLTKCQLICPIYNFETIKVLRCLWSVNSWVCFYYCSSSLAINGHSFTRRAFAVFRRKHSSGLLAKLSRMTNLMAWQMPPQFEVSSM